MQWDNPTYVVKLQLFRLYFLQMAMIALYVFTFYEQLTDNNLLGSQSSSRGSCPEDTIGSSLSNLLMTAFFVDKGITLMTIFGRRVFGGKKKAMSKPDYKVSTVAIGVIYFQALLLFTIPFVPGMAVVGSIMLYLNIKFQKFVLLMFMKMPSNRTSEKDIGSFFMFVYMISFVIALMVYYYFFYLFEGHKCGPNQNRSFMAAITTFAQSQAVTGYIYSAVFNPLILWGVVSFLVVRYFSHRFRSEIFMQAFRVMDQQSRARVEHVEGLLKKQAREVSRLRKENEELRKEED